MAKTAAALKLATPKTTARAPLVLTLAHVATTKSYERFESKGGDHIATVYLPIERFGGTPPASVTLRIEA